MVSLTFPSVILTERLTLRRLKYEDAEEIFFTYASKPEATTFISWPTHTSITDTKAFLKYAKAAWHNGTDFSFAIRLRENDRMIGGFGVVNDGGKLQVGYILGPLHWNKGYATEACKTVTSLAKEMEDVYRIQSFVDADNVASAKVLLKAGFEQEARLKLWFRFVNQNNAAKDCLHFYLPLLKQ
ncbi:MAG: GNAT family N-acetyltransferase [Chryseolinea sp.]